MVIRRGSDRPVTLHRNMFRLCLIYGRPMPPAQSHGRCRKNHRTDGDISKKRTRNTETRIRCIGLGLAQRSIRHSDASILLRARLFHSVSWIIIIIHEIPWVLASKEPSRADRRRLPDRGPQCRPVGTTGHRQDPPRHRVAIKAAQAGHRIAFAAAVDWVARLKTAHNAGRLPAELAKLRRIGLLVADEVGYIPFEQDAANLPFARWGDVFGDQVVAAATIDRIVHADVLTLKGPSYRLKDTGIDTLPSARADNTAQ